MVPLYQELTRIYKHLRANRVSQSGAAKRMIYLLHVLHTSSLLDGMLTRYEEPTCSWGYIKEGSRDSLLVQRETRDQKVVSSNPGRSGRRIFFSTVNFVC